MSSLVAELFLDNLPSGNNSTPKHLRYDIKWQPYGNNKI